MASHERILDDLAAAIVDGEIVDWEEVHRRTDLSAIEETVCNLKIINDLSRESRSTSTTARTLPGVNPLLLLLIPLVGLQMLAGAAAPLLGSVDRMRVLGWLILCAMLVFGAAGLVVAVSGRWDPRTAPLAGVFLVISSATAVSLISSLGSASHRQPLLSWFSAFLFETFFPFFLWWFVKEFPRIVRLERHGDWIAWAQRLSLGVGAALFTVNAIHRLAPSTSALDEAVPFLLRGSTTLYWFLILVIALPAPVVVFARLRHAGTEERRRAKLFLFGLAVGILPMVVAVLAEIVSPSFAEFMAAPRHRAIGSLIVYGFLFTIPFSFAYAAVARRVLDLRIVLSRAARISLALRTLWAVSVAPWLILMSVLWLNRERSLTEVLQSQLVAPLAVIGVVGIGLILSRDRLMAGIARSLHGPREGLGIALSSLTRRLAIARDAAEVAQIIQEHAPALNQAESCFVLLVNEVDRRCVSCDPRCPSLESGSALARLADASTDPISTDLRDRDSWLPFLPESDRLWVVEADVSLVLPVADSRGETIALIAFGPSKTGLPFQRVDREAASAIASAASLALARIVPEAGRGFPALVAAQDVPAGECLECGRVCETSDGRCKCGKPLRPAAIPHCLGGKFQLERVLGSGGLGIVYLGRDLALDRRVALKTLPRMRSAPLLRLRREARSMASFVHPNLAMIFGLETWRGVPILVVEFLPGGSLSQRVSRANDPLFAVDLGRKLAGAVAALHQKGMLHRDIKPANIGFSEDVEPKLLDFGLAQIIEESRVELDQNFALSVGSTGDRHDGRLTRTDQVVGTPLYLSPEVLRGGQPSPDQDLWSLHLVLWETVAGRHPLEGLPKDDALDLLLGARIPSIRNERPDCPKELAELLDRGLSRSMAARPASARGLQADLEKIAIGLRQ